jgi:hypothetical protein
MTTFAEMVRKYRWLLLVLFVASASATVIVSCGGGGGGSDGGLCDQCGDTDGPCISPALVVPGAEEPQPCPTAPLTETCVERNLICRRGVDTAQQRCYPVDAQGNLDTRFRCKGVLPGPTLRPATVTPSPATPVPTPSKTPDFNAICGNGVIEGLETCDLADFGGESCASQCPNGDGTGRLQCVNCSIDTTLCNDC